MKKIITAFAFSSVFLATTVNAYADTKNLNPCENASGILNAACKGSDKSIGSILGFVVTIAFVIAILVALLFLVWGGIKWITSGGDKGGVEAARNQIIAAIIGLIIVFLAFFILNLVLQLFGLNLFQLELPTLGGN